MQNNLSRIDTALLVLRIVLGIIMIAHGAQKLFVFGIGGVTQSFTQMGVPMPGIIGPIIAIIEFFGGIAIILGLLTRLAGLAFAADMLGAIATVHIKNGFFAPKGIEFVLAIGTMALVLAIAGAGAYSADAAIARRRAGV